MEETSKKVRHTPGPWKIDELAGPIDGEEFITIEYEGMPICEVRGTNDMSCLEDDELEEVNKEVIANAFLIASAPQLLKALEGVVKAFVESHEKYADWTATKEVFEAYMKSLEAIKLAKGEIKTELI